MRTSIAFPYSPERINTLKGLNIGARWNPTKRHWTVPTYALPLVIDALQLPKPLLETPGVGVCPSLPPGQLSALPPYQRTGVAFLQQHKRCLLADDMGLGKTRQVIEACKSECRSPLVVVCPAYLKENWKREINTWWPAAEIHIDTTRKMASEHAGVNARWRILNYEILPHDFPGCVPSVIIFDEAHYLKEGRAKRSIAARRLVEKYPNARVWLLTGTPLINRPKDLWHILKLIDPHCPEFWDFARIFCDPQRNAELGFWDLNGQSNVELLHSILNNHMLQRKQADIAGVDPITYIPRHVTIKKTREYQAANKALKVMLQEQMGYIQLSKIAEFHQLRHLTFAAKLTALVEELTADPSGKRIVFCEYRDHVTQADATLPNGYPRWAFHGGQSHAERAKCIKDFSAADCGALICTTPSGGLGWHAPGVTRVDFLDLPWTPKDLVQAASRGWDMRNPTARLNVVCWITDCNTDSSVWELLEEKKKLVAAVTSGAIQKDILERMRVRYANK